MKKIIVTVMVLLFTVSCYCYGGEFNDQNYTMYSWYTSRATLFLTNASIMATLGDIDKYNENIEQAQHCLAVGDLYFSRIGFLINTNLVGSRNDNIINLLTLEK